MPEQGGAPAAQYSQSSIAIVVSVWSGRGRRVPQCGKSVKAVAAVCTYLPYTESSSQGNLECWRGGVEVVGGDQLRGVEVVARLSSGSHTTLPKAITPVQSVRGGVADPVVQSARAIGRREGSGEIPSCLRSIRHIVQESSG